MTRLFLLAPMAVFLPCSLSAAAEGPEVPAVWRVAGNDAPELETREGAEGPLYRAGTVFTDTKLPVGYPVPTPPGAIEIKHYPVVRRAEVSGEGDAGRSGQRGFWPLFQHISRHGIAMTAPVEMEYDPAEGTEPGGWTMAFLYHDETDGPTGEDVGSVRIVDAPPVVVLSLGVRGVANLSDPENRVTPLLDWIEANEDWQRVAGAPLRVLGYNGPNVPPANRWWEVQVVIEQTHPVVVDEE